MWSSPHTTLRVVPTTNLFAAAAPLANAGLDRVITAPAQEPFEIQLDGTGSTADSGIVSYVWSVAGNQVATGAQPTVMLPPAGTVEFTLTVTDTAGLTDTDTVTIHVNPFGSGGLSGTYYDNADFTAPKFSRIDPLIDFN